jgi:hypothetical protein
MKLTGWHPSAGVERDAILSPSIKKAPHKYRVLCKPLKTILLSKQ